MLEWFASVWDQISSFFDTVWESLESAFHLLNIVVHYVGEAADCIFTLFNVLPVWIIAFSALTISISIVYILLGNVR